MGQRNDNGGDKRIAKNAVMLYIRMFLTMVVGLYTSHGVLDVPGIENYGDVGGIVAMIVFLNRSAMAVGAAWYFFSDQYLIELTLND